MSDPAPAQQDADDDTIFPVYSDLTDPDPYGPPNQDLGHGVIYDPVDTASYTENEETEGS